MPFTITHDHTSNADPAENCAFCFTPTRYWYTKKDVAVCPDCASVERARDVPSKSAWCKAIEQAFKSGVYTCPTTQRAVVIKVLNKRLMSAIPVGAVKPQPEPARHAYHVFARIDLPGQYIEWAGVVEVKGGKVLTDKDYKMVRDSVFEIIKARNDDNLRAKLALQYKQSSELLIHSMSYLGEV